MAGDSNPGDEAPRDLAAILRDLEALSGQQQGAHAELRFAVSELSRSLATLLETIRTERAQQHAKIADLQAQLARAEARLAELGDAPVGPAADDFDQLRAAAEQLRQRTEALMREAIESGPLPPADEDEYELDGEPAASSVDVATPPLATDAEPSDAEAEHAPPLDDASELEGSGLAEVAALPPRGAVLKVFPGSPEPLRRAAELAVESELDVAEPRDPFDDLELAEDLASIEPPDASAPPAQPARVAGDAEPRRTPEPIAITPRDARRRKKLRRRKIDARKLQGVEPTTALRAMVGAINPLWTAGCNLDLVIALTDGSTLRVAGGDTAPLRVEDVEPGTRARTTITATREQLVPLFGRLELTSEQSAPLIHGSRRDADLLVGWIDRAQKLEVEPL